MNQAASKAVWMAVGAGSAVVAGAIVGALAECWLASSDGETAAALGSRP